MSKIPNGLGHKENIMAKNILLVIITTFILSGCVQEKDKLQEITFNDGKIAHDYNCRYIKTYLKELQASCKNYSYKGIKRIRNVRKEFYAN